MYIGEAASRLKKTANTAMNSVLTAQFKITTATVTNKTCWKKLVLFRSKLSLNHDEDFSGFHSTSSSTTHLLAPITTEKTFDQ